MTTARAQTGLLNPAHDKPFLALKLFKMFNFSELLASKPILKYNVFLPHLDQEPKFHNGPWLFRVQAWIYLYGIQHLIINTPTLPQSKLTGL